jgi:hypothetical protein
LQEAEEAHKKLRTSMIETMEEKHLKIAELFEEEPQVLEIIQKRKTTILNLQNGVVLRDKKMVDPYTKAEWYVILKHSIDI